jgi:uncharacterized membrane protein (UPF0127 family)/predicted small secreted protein
MLRRTTVVLLVCLVAVISCNTQEESGRDGQTGAELPSGSPTFAPGKALIDTGGDSVLIDVEVAETPEQRRFGLMFRKSLGERSGMVFLFFETTSGSFWMKNTLIPLSIAFFDRDGIIRAILDMEPCKEDPCRRYHPRGSYTGALEVNQGAFDEWNVSVGDRITITH